MGNTAHQDPVEYGCLGVVALEKCGHGWAQGAVDERNASGHRALSARLHVYVCIVELGCKDPGGVPATVGEDEDELGISRHGLGMCESEWKTRCSQSGGGSEQELAS
jgi:hypothetical protein